MLNYRGMTHRKKFTAISPHRPSWGTALLRATPSWTRHRRLGWTWGSWAAWRGPPGAGHRGSGQSEESNRSIDQSEAGNYLTIGEDRDFTAPHHVDATPPPLGPGLVVGHSFASLASPSWLRGLLNDHDNQGHPPCRDHKWYLGCFVHGEVRRESALAGKRGLPRAFRVPLPQPGVYSYDFLFFARFSRENCLLGNVIKRW